MTRAAVPLLLAALLGTGACRQHRSDDAASDGGKSATAGRAPPLAITTRVASPPPTEILAPLPGFFEALPVPGHPDAWLSLPTGATSKRPVVVVIHGAGDRPDWQCGGWRHATREYPFVLCPRGVVDSASSRWNDVRYTHIGGASLLEHMDAALEELGKRYPDYVDTKAPLYAGFSLGAAELVVLAAQDAKRFPRIALIEGGTNKWSRARIDAFLNHGGVRVLFGCGQGGVYEAAKVTAARLAAEGIDTRVVYADVGHTFDPPLEEAVREQLSWWVEGDPRWPTNWDGGSP